MRVVMKERLDAIWPWEEKIFRGVVGVASKQPWGQREQLKDSPSLPFLLLLQIEPFPKGALDFGIHFPWFSFLNQLCFRHPPGHLQQEMWSDWGWVPRGAGVVGL